MADDRPVEDPAEQVGRLQRELDDLRSTVLARLTRRPTGDVEPTIRTTPKANTLLLNGQTVSRTTYAELWAWAQEASLVGTGMFTTGDGSTTFGLPNFAGRILIGVGTLGTDSYALGALTGAATRVLTTANLPSHDHNVTGTTGSGGSHNHGGSTSTSGAHSGHTALTETTPGGQFGGVAAQNISAGGHSHSFTTDTEAAHTHSLSITESLVGSGTALDIRQASIAINWLVWI